MPRSPFEYRLGLDQGRIEPETRAISPDDLPTSAVLVALTSEPYALEDQDNLLIAIDGGTTQQVIFDTLDFIDITKATAAEVAAVLAAQVTGVTADVVNSQVRLTTISTGLSASFNVTGGSGQNAIEFPTGLITGTQGKWAFVLGHELPGRVFTFTTGDNIEVNQTALFNDALIWRLRGAIRWRTGGNETGSSWEVRIRVGGATHVTVLDNDQLDPELPELVSLDDVAVNVSTLGGATEVEIALVAVDTGGPGDFAQELPAVFIDFMEFDEAAADLEIANRFPAPAATGQVASIMDVVEFDVLNTTAVALDLSETRVVVNGSIVFDAGAFVGPFSGTVTAATGPAGRDTNFVIDVSSLAPFASEEEITIEVDTETTAGASTLGDSWSFFMEDTIAPQVTAAQARSKQVVRVFFSEPVLMDATAGGALNVANYLITPETSPAVTVIPQSVAMVSASSVDVTVDLELSLNANYLVSVSNVEDLAENALSTIIHTAQFPAFRPPQPPGRSFQLWDRVPPHDRRRDATIPTRPLRKFILVLQDVVDLLLCDIDRWTEILDIDLAPEAFLDAILRDLGNPFDFVRELSLIEKRRLARILVDIYKEKGTDIGIINAIRFFLGIEVELDIINCRDYWKMGVHQLNLDTIIGPGTGSPLWYSFFIVSPVILTADQQQQMLKIADYMKPAHEHILGIQEPGGLVTPGTFWHLGIDTLGATTVLGA